MQKREVGPESETIPSHWVDLVLPGFENAVPSGTVGQISFHPREADAWFKEFADRVYAAIGNQYLPIYRMADGEFRFAVGYRVPRPRLGASRLAHYVREGLAILLLRRRAARFRTVYGEAYTNSEQSRARDLYISMLRDITGHGGILAVFLAKQSDGFASEYFAPMMAWLSEHRIGLSPSSYYPFYFVYALLNGPERNRLYRGRRVLVVTSLTPAKERAIREGLEQAGAADIQFMPISPNKALLDRIELGSIQAPIDLAMVGAGIGAANILLQLQSLNTVCIDAGFCLDLLADPTLAGQRYFTKPDAEIIR